MAPHGLADRHRGLFLLIVAGTVVSVFTSEFHPWELLACAVPIPVAAALAGLSVLGSFSGRREVAYLKS